MKLAELGDLDGEARLVVVGEGDAADAQGRALHRLELGLHRGELLGLAVGEMAGAQVAGDDLEGREDGDQPQAEHYRLLVVLGAVAAEHGEGVDAGDSEADGDVGGKSAVGELIGKGVVGQHGGPGFDVRRHAVDDIEAGGLVHPGVDADDEERRSQRGRGDGNRAEPVRLGRELVPTVEVEAEEDRLDEEGESLQEQGQADDAAGEVHPARPEEAEGEGEDGAGDGADGEEHGGDDGPALGQPEVELLAGAEVEPFSGEEEQGQTDADGGEVDVEAEGHAHEGASAA